MERRFDMTNFEQSLKDQADQLDMIPSRRVWNGIYNNLHPGSRWPSIAMAFLFLFTILGIGHLNNTRKLAGINIQPQNQSEINSDLQNELNSSNEIQDESNSAKQDLQNKPGTYFKGNFTADNKKNQFLKDVNKDVNNKEKLSNPASGFSAKLIPLYPDKAADVIADNNADVLKNLAEKVPNNNAQSEKKITAIVAINSDKNSLNEIQKQSTQTKEDESSNFKTAENEKLVGNNISDFTTNNTTLKDLDQDKLVAISEPLITINEAASIQASTERNAEKAQINEAAKKKQKPVKKRNEKISWLFYITPSLTTATFLDNGKQPINSNSSSLIIRGNQNSSGMTYNSRFGFETGTEMSYAFWKKLQFITGLHFSYSGYNVVSNQVHPTFATLILKQEASGLPYSKGYMTHYGNGQSQNQISLSNYSLQLSIPVGLQQALFENEKIRVDIATTIEPSYVLKSNAFLISADERYYVKDPSLLRKINLSGHAGTFVTFKTPKFKWQLGPTVRYQLLSTYQKTYPVKEHLLDYGIRIGISK